jgi:hypothetical protein
VKRYWRIVAAPALLLVVACASSAKRTADDFDAGAAPRAKFVRDAEICARQAEADQRRFGIGGDIGASQATYNRMYEGCMRASGYERKAEGK